MKTTALKTFCLLICAILLCCDAAAQEKTLRPLFEKYGICVRNQGSRGTCSIFTLVGMIEFERANVLGETTALSPEYLNWAANRIEGADADGSYFHFAIDGMSRYGICADDYMPYAVRFSEKAEPSEAAKQEAASRKAGKQVWIKEWDPTNGVTDTQLQRIREELNGEHPVAIGFRWPKEEAKNGHLTGGDLAVVAEDEVFDGHSVLVVGYADDGKYAGGGCLIFKNSHGDSFGEGGYGRIPYAYAKLYANDVMALHLK